MNCEDFKDRLYEFLDGSLTGQVQAAAQEHLRQCEVCRRVQQHEKAVAAGIQTSLHHATRGLSLQAGTLHKVLGTWESERVAPGTFARAWQCVEWFLSSPVRPIGAGAILLVALFVLLGRPGHRDSSVNSAAPAEDELGCATWVVDVPIQTQTRHFRRQGNQVIDALASSGALGHARLP